MSGRNGREALTDFQVKRCEHASFPFGQDTDLAGRVQGLEGMSFSQEPAQYSVGYIRHTGVSSDGETVTINGRVYEYDTGGAVGAGHIAVDISGGNSASQSATALAAAINADTGASVDAKVTAGGSFGLRAVKIHADVLHLIGSYAALLPLATAGDLIAGAGIAAKSIGLDGLSTSIQTTASAENSGYSARVHQFLDDVKRLIPLLRRYYHGPTLRVA